MKLLSEHQPELPHQCLFVIITLGSEWNIGCGNLLSHKQYAFFDYINNFLPTGETDWAFHFIVITLEQKTTDWL